MKRKYRIKRNVWVGEKLFTPQDGIVELDLSSVAEALIGRSFEPIEDEPEPEPETRRSYRRKTKAAEAAPEAAPEENEEIEDGSS